MEEAKGHRKYRLCYRCEHRARYHETGERPRFECGDIGTAFISCYMYIPVKPFVIKKDDGDKRDAFGPSFIAARCHAVDVADMTLKLEEQKDNAYMAYWVK